MLLSCCAIPFVCRVTPFIHCGTLLFLHSPPPAHRGILLSRCAIPFVCRRLLLSHHRPPTIFCCISSFCCRIPLSHRGIFFRSLQHSFCLLRYSSPLPSFASFLPPYAYSLLQKAFFPPQHASHPPISQKAFVTSPAKSSYYPFVCIAEDEKLECRQRAVVSAFLRIDRLMRNALRRTFFLYTPAPHRKLQRDRPYSPTRSPSGGAVCRKMLSSKSCRKLISP